MTSRPPAAVLLGLAAGTFIQPLILVGFARIAARVELDAVEESRRLAALHLARAVVQQMRHERPAKPAAGKDVSGPLDPWGNAFVVETDPATGWLDVISLGADGRRGGTGPGADISARFGAPARPPRTAVHIAGALVALLVPLAGLTGSARSVVCRGLLAGSSLVMGLALLACIRAPAGPADLPAFAGAAAAGLAAVSGACGILARARAAPAVAVLGAGACYAAFSLLAPL